jgi:hypothetical protein
VNNLPFCIAGYLSRITVTVSLLCISTKRTAQLQILYTIHSSDVTSKIRTIAMFVIVDMQMMFHIETQVFHDSYNVSINKCLPTLPNLRKTLVKCCIWCMGLHDAET